MRKLGIAIGVFVLLIVIAVLLLPALIDVNSYRGRIQSELETRMNRKVELGEMDLKLLPPRIRVKNVRIGEDKNFTVISQRPFATAQELYVSVKLLPLLTKDVQVNALELRRPEIELIRNQQGIWNFSTLGNRNVAGATTPAQSQAETKPSPQKQAGGEPAQQQPAQQFSLAELEITDGLVAITDLQKHQTRAVYDHIDVRLMDFAPGKPFSIEAAAHLPGQGKQTLELEGRGGPINDASLIQTPFNGSLNLNEVSLSGAQKFLNSEALAGTEAMLTGKVKVQNKDGKLQSSGSIKVDDANIRGTKIGYPITADYDIADDLNTDVIQISKATVKLGPTPLTVTGSMNTRSTPSQLDLALQASNASIAEMARLAGAFGVAFNPGMEVAGKVDANLTAKGQSDKPILNGTVAARDVNISGSDLPKPVRVSAINLALSPDVIRSNDFTASTGNTNLNLRFALSKYATPQPSIDANLKAANASVGELINIANAYGVEAAKGTKGSGTISIDVHAVGPLKNTTAMTFSGSGAVQNASVQTPDLKQPLNIKNANLKFTQNSIVLENLQASLGSTNATGALTVRGFEAPQVQFTLNADKVNVIELQNITGTATAQPAKKAANWKLIPNAYAAAPPEPSILTKATGTGTVSAGVIQYDTLVLNNVRSNVTLDKGVIRLSPVTADVYGGKESGTIVVNTRSTPTTYQVSMKLDSVDANKMVSSMSSARDVLYGLLAANTNASFASVPAGGDIAKTLNGKLSLNLRNGRLANVDMLDKLSAVGKFQSLGRSAQGFTKISQLTGDFDVKNGVANTQNLRAVTDAGNLAGEGIVNLVDQTLNMKVTAVLTKETTGTVGGSSIGGFMSTALANNKGEMVMPVIITGTLQNPNVAPDMSRIAEMKLNNLLPSSGNPGSLTTGLLGAISGKGEGGQQGGVVGGILGALGGKQQQKQQQAAPKSDSQAQEEKQQDFGQAATDLFNALGGSKKKKQQQQQQPQQ
jgi:AsmA protein